MRLQDEMENGSVRTLLIDTAGQDGVVALTEGDHVVAEARLPGRTASEGLMPAIRRMFGEAGWKVSELTAIGVVQGPGSFTGVRVGLSAAKGLSEAVSVPLIAVSRLRLLVSMAAVGANGASAWAFLNAGRGEVYGGEYVRSVCAREVLLSAAEAVSAVRERSGVSVVVCEPVVEELLRELNPRSLQEPGAVDLLPLILERLRTGAMEDALTIDANYIRRTDLEMLATMEARRAERAGR